MHSQRLCVPLLEPAQALRNLRQLDVQRAEDRQAAEPAALIPFCTCCQAISMVLPVDRRMLSVL
eukprot:2945807-Alexandrium_andersonii.AAC.1